jgi:hypothetical protein
MARRITPSQFLSKLRQIENKRMQAINKYNQEVRKHNQDVLRAANNYNNEVRKHNARVRANRQKIINELNRLKSRTIVRHEVLRTSTIALNSSYQSLEAREPDIERMAFGNEFLDLSEKENANSLAVSNALEDEESESLAGSEASLSSTVITNELSLISPDLDSRWRGALYSLSPRNPDASRHFCTSAREIFVHILDHYAPDAAVLAQYPECEKTDNGHPTRRWKVKHILVRAGIISEEAVDFVDEDVHNVLQLFRVFNDGTHGSAGKFELSKLTAIKERVESGISYLSAICERA